MNGVRIPGDSVIEARSYCRGVGLARRKMM